MLKRSFFKRGWVFFVNNNPIVHGKRDNKGIWSLFNKSLVRRMKNILDLKDIEGYRYDLKY